MVAGANTEAELLNRIADLERELGLARDRDAAQRIRKRLGVTPQEAQILYALHAAYPRSVQLWALESNLPSIWRSGENANFIRVHISRLRHKLGRDTIETVEGSSYALSEDGAEKVKDAQQYVISHRHRGDA